MAYFAAAATTVVTGSGLHNVFVDLIEAYNRTKQTVGETNDMMHLIESTLYSLNSLQDHHYTEGTRRNVHYLGIAVQDALKFIRRHKRRWRILRFARSQHYADRAAYHKRQVTLWTQATLNHVFWSQFISGSAKGSDVSSDVVSL